MTYVADTAVGESAIVRAVSTRSRCKHDVVTIQTSWPALLWIIVLKSKSVDLEKI